MLKNYSDTKTQVRPVNLSYSSDIGLSELVRDRYRREPVRKLDRSPLMAALEKNDIKTLRQMSKQAYRTQGYYARLVDYYSTLPTYCWAMFPRLRSTGVSKSVTKNWWQAISYIEMINPQHLGPIIARKVLLDGACYIAVKDYDSKEGRIYAVQFLPIDYCRSVKRFRNQEMVDFDVSYFDTLDSAARAAALQTFPKDVVESYQQWKKAKRKTTDTTSISSRAWVTLDSNYSYKFTLRPDDVPYFIGTALDLLDIQDAKDITMYKLEQELNKILVQKFGVTNTGEPIVTLPELRSFQADTQRNLGSIPGLSVITTYADVDVETLSKTTASDSASSPVEKVNSDFYDAAGASSLLFNANNAGSMSRSIVKDEAMMFQLVEQLRQFLQLRLDLNFNIKGVLKMAPLRVEMPHVTQFNFKEMYDLYSKDATVASKTLAQVCLGRSQGDVLSSLFFESGFADILSEDTSKTSTSASTGDDQRGRPQLDDADRSEKTLQNRESLGGAE